MSTVLTVVASLIAVPLAIILAYFTIETLLGLARLRPSGTDLSMAAPRTTVMIPAHNEGLLIAKTVEHLKNSAQAGETLPHILVVADNCNDGTADTARAAGAHVIERHDPELRGKGFALAFGRDHLAALPEQKRPQVVIVIDADCRMSVTSVQRLANQAHQQQAPMQARNLLVPRTQVLPRVQISNFAMLVKNGVRARGLSRIAGGITLYGNGMAFPWPLFSQVQLASSHVTEDMELALNLARAGTKVQLVEDALVESDPAPSQEMAAQRSRWEHGFLATAAEHAIPLLKTGLQKRSRHLLGLGVHLLVPPLALLLAVGGFGLAITGLMTLLGAGIWPAATLAAALAAALLVVAAAWLLEGRSTLSLKAALSAPFYILWKVPLYLKFFTQRQTEWNRTRREGEDD